MKRKRFVRKLTWVANADSENVASATRYTKYNLAELLGRKNTTGSGKLTGIVNKDDDES